MPDKINISELFDASSYTLLDVRSLSEFAKGHIPNAINLPLFTNEERAIVGTIYKQESKEEAFLKGLDIVGGKMSGFIKELNDILPKENHVVVYCWRGGKRSGSMAWLFEMAGFDVKKLEGGYKAYRKFIRNIFQEISPEFLVLTGSTGSGKTETLQQLKKHNQQIIDLESLAQHKGSAFGNLGEKTQPSTEQFENNLYESFRKLDLSKQIWLESESRMIGNVCLPETFWEQMSQSKMIHLKIAKEARVQYLVDNYGKYSKADLANSFQKLKKKLAQHLNIALEAIEEDDLGKAASIALDYYDKYYNKHLQKNKDRIQYTLSFEEMDFELFCQKLLALKVD